MDAGGRGTNFSLEELPEDVQLSIISFLTPEEAGNFSCTSKHFAELYRDGRSRLWRSLCDRRWGHVTTISAWGQGNASYKLLYQTLHGWENLLGFWRLCGTAQRSSASYPYHEQPSPPSLVFFEWGPWFLSGSRVSPVQDGTHHVVKTPFLWMWITSEGQVSSYLDPDGNVGEKIALRNPDLDLDLIPVNVDLIGYTHLRVEEDAGRIYGINTREESSSYNEEDIITQGSPGNTLNLYEYYANRRSSNGCRRQRKKEHGRLERRRRLPKWETEHFIKIVDSSPTPDRPLQGIWKGITEDEKLDFFLVTYDGLGLSCRRIADLSERLASCKPVFWTAHPTLFEGPLQPEDALIYHSRMHLQAQSFQTKPSTVTHFMIINSSYDLVLSGLTELFKNPWRVEGRIWQYKNGTFGFGFLRDNFIVDLMHVSRNGHLLDVADHDWD